MSGEIPTKIKGLIDRIVYEQEIVVEAAMKRDLALASAVAASNLFAENSIDGILPAKDIEKLAEKYGRIKL